MCDCFKCDTILKAKYQMHLTMILTINLFCLGFLYSVVFSKESAWESLANWPLATKIHKFVALISSFVSPSFIMRKASRRTKPHLTKCRSTTPQWINRFVSFLFIFARISISFCLQLSQPKKWYDKKNYRLTDDVCPISFETHS